VPVRHGWVAVFVTYCEYPVIMTKFTGGKKLHSEVRTAQLFTVRCSDLLCDYSATTNITENSRSATICAIFIDFVPTSDTGTVPLSALRKTGKI